MTTTDFPHTDILDKFTQLQKAVNSAIFERDEEVHTAILALLSRRHHFQLGPPGVAKSLLVEEITSRIQGMDDDAYFKWLLTKFTVPEELFGGPDFTLLKEKGAYKRVTDRKLPKAKVAFLDETFKGNSSILNALLKIMNEREFDNMDDDPRTPLISMFGASNELPATNELDALADRFTFYHQVSRIRDMGSFMSMIGNTVDTTSVITLDELMEAQALVETVVVPDEVKEALWQLRGTLAENDVLVSDRRFFQSIAVVQAEAFLNGRMTAQVVDTKPLRHVMWRDPSHLDLVRKIVLDLADPLEREALELLAELEKAADSFNSAVKDTQNKSKRIKAALEVWEKVKEADKEIAALRKREEELGRKCDAIRKVVKRKKEIAKTLMVEGMSMSPTDDDDDED